MKSCHFSNFIQTLKPWLNDDYIKSAFWDTQGNFRLQYVDGGEKVYRINDCSQAQLDDVLQMLKSGGVNLVEEKVVCEKPANQ
jgi:hypothetical protein